MSGGKPHTRAVRDVRSSAIEQFDVFGNDLRKAAALVLKETRERRPRRPACPLPRAADQSPVPAQMWQGWARSRRRCGQGWARSRRRCGQVALLGAQRTSATSSNLRPWLPSLSPRPLSGPWPCLAGGTDTHHADPRRSDDASLRSNARAREQRAAADTERRKRMSAVTEALLDTSVCRC
jgi:hypothetical protein